MNHPYAVTAEELAKDLSSSPQGLSSQEVQARLERYGPNRLACTLFPYTTLFRSKRKRP